MRIYLLPYNRYRYTRKPNVHWNDKETIRSRREGMASRTREKRVLQSAVALSAGVLFALAFLTFIYFWSN